MNDYDDSDTEDSIDRALRNAKGPICEPDYDDSDTEDSIDRALRNAKGPICEPDYDGESSYVDDFYMEDVEGNIISPTGEIFKKGEKVYERSVKKETIIDRTIPNITKITEETTEKTVETDESKIEKDEDINFGRLVTRNVMRATYRLLENYLVLFPKHGFPNEISGMILYGPNGTGKTEFCEKMMTFRTFADYCDFERVDIYHLIDSKMGKSSENVAKKFKEWQAAYKKKDKIQVKIIDEGELIFIQKKDRGSKAYAELSNSMLKHTGKFSGIFLIIITNNLEFLDKGAISRFDRIYWPPLDAEERLNFMIYGLKNSGIKIDETNLNKLSPHLNWRYGDIRTQKKLISYVKGWFVRNRKTEDVINTEKDLIPLMIDFNKKMDNETTDKDKESRYNKYNEEIISPDDGFKYPSEKEMIDFLIKNSAPHLINNWIEFKRNWEMKGCVGNQLEYHLKPGYRRLKLK